MATKTGICQYAWINASTTPFGIVDSGSMSFGEAPEHRQGIGGVDVLVGKLYVPTVSVDFSITDNAILDYAFRATTGFPCSSLTATTVGVGNGIDEKQLLGAKCNSLSISGAVDEPIKCSMEFMGTGITATTYTKPTQTIGNHYEWYRSAVLINAITTVRVKSFDIEIANNLEAVSTLKEASANSMRLPEELIEGDQNISLSITTQEPISNTVLGILADDIVTNLTFAATNTKVGGSGTLTLSLSNLVCAGIEQPIQSDGILEYSYSFETPHNNASLTIS